MTASNSDWPEGHTVIIDGVTYGEHDIVPGTDKTFNDPWWAIVGPGGMTNWQVFGPGGAGGYVDTSLNPDWFGGGEADEAEKSSGGRRTTSRTASSDDEDPAPVEGWFDEFAQHFPGYAKLLEAFPSMMETVGAWWEDEKDSDYNQQYNSLLGAIKGSAWYEDHEEPMRDSFVLQFTDPAQWAANLETNLFDIKSFAKEEGLYDYFNSRSGYWDGMAEQAERNAWSEEQIRTRLVQDGLASPTAPVRGQIKRNMDKIKSYANSMMVNMSDTDARKFASYMEATGGFYHMVPTDPDGPPGPGTRREFQGAMSWAGVQDHIHGLAKNKWGFIDVDDLAERGLTIADTLSEVKNTIATTLQLNSENINLMGIGADDLIFGEKTDSGDGRRFMDIQEAENWAKRQSRYEMTDGFRGDIRDLAGSIAQAWGTR